MVDLLYVGHSPLSEVYLMYMMFQVLALFPSKCDWLSSY
jgi:hypothetical protein